MVVTGGASNIGRAISLAFGSEAATVLIADRDIRQAERTANDIIANGGKAYGIALDLTDAPAVEAAAADIESRIGAVDVLVNNIGWNGHQEFFLALGPERWEKSFRFLMLR